MTSRSTIIFAVIIVGLAILYFAISSRGSHSIVSDFDQCVLAGYSVMESYPARCATPDGKTFVQDIGNELEKTNLIRVTNPRPHQTVNTPFLVQGEARGFWYFEATFPVKLIDEEDNMIWQHYAQAQGEWMTEDFVPFEVLVDADVSGFKKGFLILEKSNPSDLSEYADELRIPLNLAGN